MIDIHDQLHKLRSEKNSKDFISDYHFLYQKLEAYSDYITINISSPNTPGLRDIQEKGNIEKLVSSLSTIKKKKPISKNEILKRVWEYSPEVDTHTVETHIYRLRKKISEKFLDEGFILNNKSGYHL